ncbi:MAG: hypothetical protein IPM22_06745 [Betaproteobacteria bacterium]|nr:hypothetical protein [Betaproteobacteria bacterium]MCC7215818.1 hypothetical protein [Burkholderiales bacterium]
MPRRDALGCFLRHLARGERIAERVAHRQAALAPDAPAARFLASQARQEAMHAAVFDAAAAALRVPADAIDDAPYAAYEARLAAALDRGDFVASVVGTQVVLEALGDALLARLDRGLAAHGAGFVRLRRRIRAQEAAHHAFGRALLDRLVATGGATDAAVGAHERAYRQCALALLTAAEPMLRHFALTPATIAADLDARLAGAPAP